MKQLQSLKNTGDRLGKAIAGFGSDASVKISTRETFQTSAKSKVGISMSGGGIRSATFNLGALQVLHERGILEKADHVAAVSGGAYIASALALTQHNLESRRDAGSLSAWAHGSDEEEHLRNNASYLAPTPWKKLEAFGTWARGFLINFLILAFTIVIVGSLLGWTFRYMHPALREGATVDWIQEHRYLAAAMVLWAFGLLMFLVDAIFDLSMWRYHTVRSSARWLMTLGLLFLLILSIPYLLLLLRRIRDDPTDFLSALGFTDQSSGGSGYTGSWLGLVEIVAAVNIVIAAVRGLLAKKRSIYVQVVAATAGPLLLALGLLTVTDYAAYAGMWLDLPGTFWGEGALIALGVGLLILVLEVFFNCNKTTMHNFYAHRLATVFAVARSNIGPERMSDRVPIRLSERQPKTGPTFTYCAAANAVGDGTTPPGRNALPFVFSSDYCGGTVVGSMPAESLEVCAPWLSVPSAVAISGAAFSPTMGKHTRRSLTFLMTLMNLRLGMWAPNPNFAALVKEERPDNKSRVRWSWRSKLTTFSVRRFPSRPKPGLRYLMYEFMGWHRLDRRYLYLTDGGHYDNLGLIELLRRGCNEIYCFDASGDSMETFNTLGEAIAIARSDHGVEFDIDPRKMLPNKDDGLAKYGHVVGHFKTPERGGQPEREGTILFVKAAVTGSSPWDVQAFRKKDANFPNHSTADQLFTDNKFESYRALGRHQTRKALDSLDVLHGPFTANGKEPAPQESIRL